MWARRAVTDERGGWVVADTITSLAELVTRAASRFAERPALIGFDVELTWSEVEAQTASLAASLVAAGVQPGDRVAIAMAKTHRSFLSVHAILRAGGVVVPIDPLAPSDVAVGVVDDADVVAAVGDRRTFDRFGLRGRPWPSGAIVADATDAVAGETSWDRAVAHPRGPLPTPDPDAPAYIIYTSGSTGRPKGIVHTNRSALAYAERAVPEYGLGPDDRVAGMNPLHFDMSTLELYAAPLAGAAVVVMGELHMKLPASFVTRCAEHRVTLWYGVPFFLNQLVERGGLDRVDLTSLRTLLHAGEPYAPGALGNLVRLLPPVHLVNVYGPAEVNACTHFHFDTVEELGDRTAVPIGQTWEGADATVRDANGELVDPGDPGELWISAVTRMQGYWGRDDLTGDRTEARPDGTDWYRTGDLVVEDAGELVYLGRIDHQVKVRGMRIELEGVESVLSDAPGVAHAVAGAIGEGDDLSHLAAVIIAEAGVTPDIEAITEWCIKRLPPVAVPTSITITDRFPATASGKIDRRTVRADLLRGAHA